MANGTMESAGNTSPPVDPPDTLINFELAAPQTINQDQQLIFGWASIVVTDTGQEVTDAHGHVIPPEELEQAVYTFVRCGGMASEMHEAMYKGCLVESMVFTREKTKALGLPDNLLPTGWWVGIYVYNAEDFEKIKSGKYKMLSIAGKALAEDY